MLGLPGQHGLIPQPSRYFDPSQESGEFSPDRADGDDKSEAPPWGPEVAYPRPVGAPSLKRGMKKPDVQTRALADRIVGAIEGRFRDWLMQGEHEEAVELVAKILENALDQPRDGNPPAG